MTTERTKVNIEGIPVWDAVTGYAEQARMRAGFGPSELLHVWEHTETLNSLEAIHRMFHERMRSQVRIEEVRYRGASVEIELEWCESCQDYHTKWKCSVCQYENFCGYWDYHETEKLEVCRKCGAEVPLHRKEEPEDG